MKQARCVLSTYSADLFGVCSALFELGGMTVMHDASGCNSTYSTHDEPRWYDTQSLVFISGLTEMETIMGDDSKLLGDLRAAVEELHPNFVALAGSPIPMMVGCDIPTLAAQLEEETGIPCFGFQTSGMHTYLPGVSDALAAIADRMTDPDAVMRPGTVNILGATPLDFSTNGTVPAMKHLLENAGWKVISTFAMDSTLEDIRRAGEAQVNLVISGTGSKAAQVLKKKFHTPCVTGTPVGQEFSAVILDKLAEAARTGKDALAFSGIFVPDDSTIFILGEGVTSRSLSAALALECGISARVIHTLEDLPQLAGVLTPADAVASEEEELQELLRDASVVIADPLYRPIVPAGCQFLPLPHEAFSGRIGRAQIPVLPTLDLKRWYPDR